MFYPNKKLDLISAFAKGIITTRSTSRYQDWHRLATPRDDSVIFNQLYGIRKEGHTYMPKGKLKSLHKDKIKSLKHTLTPIVENQKDPKNFKKLNLIRALINKKAGQSPVKKEDPNVGQSPMLATDPQYSSSNQRVKLPVEAITKVIQLSKVREIVKKKSLHPTFANLEEPVFSSKAFSKKTLQTKKNKPLFNNLKQTSNEIVLKPTNKLLNTNIFLNKIYPMTRNVDPCAEAKLQRKLQDRRFALEDVGFANLMCGANYPLTRIFDQKNLNSNIMFNTNIGVPKTILLNKNKTNKKNYNISSEITLITISLASAKRIRQWAEKILPNGKVVGEVINPETIHYKTLKPIKGGLFCERIFGPLKDHECACGKKFNIKNYLKNLNFKEIPLEQLQKRYFCRICDVEYTYSIIRRTQLGFIELVSPITHVWFIKGMPSYIAILLDMKKKHLQNITYNTNALTLEYAFRGRQFLPSSPKSIFESWQKIMKKQYPERYAQKSKNLKSPLTRIFDIGSAKINVDSTNISQTNPAYQTKLSLFYKEDFEQEIFLFTKKNYLKNYIFNENLQSKKLTNKPKTDSYLVKNKNSSHKSNFRGNFKKPPFKNISIIKPSTYNDFIENHKLLKLNKNYKSQHPLTRIFGSEASLQRNLQDQRFSLEDKNPNILNKKNSILKNFLYLKQNLSNACHKNKKIKKLITKRLRTLYHKTLQTFKKENSDRRFSLEVGVDTKIQACSGYPKMFKNKRILNVSKGWLRQKNLGLPKLYNRRVSVQRNNIKNIKFFIAQQSSVLPKVGWSNLLFTSFLHKHSYNSLFFIAVEVPIKIDLFMFLPIPISMFLNKSINDVLTLQRKLLDVQLKKIRCLICFKNLLLTIFMSNLKIKDLNVTNNLNIFLKYLKKYKTKNMFLKSNTFLFCWRSQHFKCVFEKINVLLVKFSRFAPFKKLKIVKKLYAKSFLKRFLKTSYNNFGFADLSKVCLNRFNLTPERKIINLFSIINFYFLKFSKKKLAKELYLSLLMVFAPRFSLEVKNQYQKSYITFSKNYYNNLKTLNIQKIKSPTFSQKNLLPQFKTFFYTSLNTLKKIVSLNKNLINNVYCLSHRKLWEQEKDWQDFAYFYYSQTNITDQPIPYYKHRNYDILFNKLSQDLFFTFEKNISVNTANINTSFSGAGLIEKLLNDFNYTELKKMDKQNRLLLFEYNKYLKKLKKMSKNKNKILNIVYYKACKNLNVLIRRTKLTRKLLNSKDFFVNVGSANSKFVGEANKLNPTKNSSSVLLEKHENKVGSIVTKDKDLNMILTLLPVLPPVLRPVLKIGGQFTISDLNRLYQRIIYRNERLKKFLKDPALNSSFEMKYAQRLLQEAVDNLIQNGKSGVIPEKDARGRLLKSLSEILKGKQGRFRQYLLGKRVDYSGRSVIVVGPHLKLHECGIPKEMALVLYSPFLIKRILNQKLADTYLSAKKLIKTNPLLVSQLLREIMKTCPVLLNRAPTLHRLGFQAFQPKLVDGKAILLHPLVCPAFNADFDGDQMAVHIPITFEARAEAWKLMLARNNLLSPATGEPIILPSQDMVLGCYYLTTNCSEKWSKFKKGSGMYFHSVNDVLKAYNQKLIHIHAVIWVNIQGHIENGNIIEQPLEIRLPLTYYIQNKDNNLDMSYVGGTTNSKFGLNLIEIYSKSHYLLDIEEFTNLVDRSFSSKDSRIYSRQVILTTPGKILFNNLIKNAIEKRPLLFSKYTNTTLSLKTKLIQRI